MSAIEVRLHGFCKDLAQTAWVEYTRCISELLYLYGFEGGDEFNGKHGYTELRLCRDQPRYFDLVLCEAIPRDRSVDQLKMWFIDRLRREPILFALPEEETVAS